MTPTTKKIIEEWRKLRDEDYEYMSNHQISNWWLSKLDHLLEEKIKAIEGKKLKPFTEIGGTFNYALDLAISILKQ